MKFFYVINVFSRAHEPCRFCLGIELISFWYLNLFFIVAYYDIHLTTLSCYFRISQFNREILFSLLTAWECVLNAASVLWNCFTTCSDPSFLFVFLTARAWASTGWVNCILGCRCATDNSLDTLTERQDIDLHSQIPCTNRSKT